MRQFGLIGYPLTHSFSKKFFTEKFEQEKRSDCQYELFSIDSIEKIKTVLKEHPQLEGLNVTIPYKQQVMQYLDSHNDIPAGVNACNCIHVINNKLAGYNTDITGFEKSFIPLLQSHHNKALVLGNGGAAIAVIYVLNKLGIETCIVSRKLHGNSSFTYAEINKKIIQENTVIINTTPLGMYPQTENYPDIPYEFITDKHLLYDLHYNPAKTKFLQKGEVKGATIKNGEEMLIIQAEESWRIWCSGQ